MKNSNARAFTEIYNRYSTKIFAIATFKLRDQSMAQEFVQELFLNIWERRKSICITEHLLKYLIKALKYKLLNLKRKYLIEQKYLEYHRSKDETHYSLEQDLQFHELINQVKFSIEKLPEKCKTVFLLSREKGFHQKDIAKQLSISEKTVEAHLTRALKFIRKEVLTLRGNN